VLSWFIFSFLLLFYPSGRKNLPGIIVVSSLSLVSVINGLFLKLRSPKSQFIFEIRDIWPLTLTDIGGYSRYNPLVLLLGWIEKAGYRKADNIVATMPRADLHIRNRIGSDFNFTCIPQGLDLYNADSDTELTDEERKMIFPDGGFIIGYAGALGRSNSLDTLVNSARIINDMGIRNIYFILLGDGSEKDHLVSLAKGLGNVRFIPRIPRKKVHSFLKYCTVLHDSVLPVGLYQYGLSRNKWMDYMYSGKPVVVSYSGHISLINEADCGQFVPAGDAEKLAQAILHYHKMDTDQLRIIGQRGRDFVINNRSFAKLASEYVKIFRY
jgi:glycosyltransferase involved in cell wall biosynthesis